MPGTIEVDCPWGGTAQLDPTGDLLLIQDGIPDVDGNPAPATSQRIIVTINTNPILLNDLGVAVGRPDDLRNPKFGAGIRRLIGKNPTPAVLNAVKAAILQSLQTDPGVMPGSGKVTVTSGIGFVIYTISATTNLGVPFTIPSQKLQVFAASGG